MEDKYIKGEKELDEGLTIPTSDRLGADPNFEQKPEESFEVAVFGIGKGGSIASHPIIHNNKIYFGACDHNFYCLDLKTGKQVWRFETKDIIISSPVVENGVVYFSSYDKGIYAINAETGKQIWKVQADSPVFCSPNLYKGILYIGSLGGTFYAIDCKSGKIIWKFHAGDIIVSYPVSFGDKVYFGSYNNNIYALDYKTGEKIWGLKVDGAIHTDMLCVDGILYSGGGKRFYAIDTKTGEIKWKFTAKSVVVGVFPTVYKKYIYVPSWDRNLYCLDKDTGKSVWTYKLGDNAISATRIYEGILYIGSMDKNLYAIDAEKGELIRKIKTKDMVTASPAFQDGVLYFGSWDCNLYAVTTEGEQKWKFTTSNPMPSPISIDPAVFESKNPKFVWDSMGTTPPDLYRQHRQSDGFGGSVYGSRTSAYIKKNRYTEGGSRYV